MAQAGSVQLVAAPPRGEQLGGGPWAKPRCGLGPGLQRGALRSPTALRACRRPGGVSADAARVPLSGERSGTP